MAGVGPGRLLGRAEEQFIQLGVQYFVLARHAAFCLYPQTAAYNCHVAFEMLFEAELVRTGSTKAQMAKFHHDLDALWKSFKATARWKPDSKWDAVVNQLDEWRNVRFPTGEYASMGLGVTGWVEVADQAIDAESGAPIGRKAIGHPRYRMKLWQLDELFKLVVSRLSLDPLWVKAIMGEGAETYLRQNHHPVF